MSLAVNPYDLTGLLLSAGRIQQGISYARSELVSEGWANWANNVIGQLALALCSVGMVGQQREQVIEIDERAEFLLAIALAVLDGKSSASEPSP